MGRRGGDVEVPNNGGSIAELPRGELSETVAEVFEESFQLAAEANGIGFGVL